MRAFASLATLSVVTLLARRAGCSERQVAVAGHVGLGGSSGPLGGLGPAADLGVTYGLNDAFSLYGSTGYALGLPGGAHGPRHSGLLSVGVTYAFDYVRVVPYAGVGLRGDVVATSATTWVTPAAEVRGGVYYLLSRTVALDLQATYALPFLSTERSSDFFTVAFGVRYLRDL